MLGPVLVSGERKTVRLYGSPTEIHSQEVHSDSRLHDGLGKSIGSCVKMYHWVTVSDGGGVGATFNFSEEAVAQSYFREHERVAKKMGVRR